MNITIALTPADVLALSYSHTDFEFFLNSLTVGHVNRATDEIVQLATKHCLDNGIQLPATREEVVAFAFAQGIVSAAIDRKPIDYTMPTGAV